jgi:plastocyanin
VNRGKLTHSFSIAGQKTPLLKTGLSASLTIIFANAGSYKYYSTVAGEARKGMRGVFGVRAGTTASSKPAPKVSTPAGGAAAAVAGGGPCTSPASTAVSVKIFEYGFTLSQTSVPCGTVTFNVVNQGLIAHTFDVQTIGPGGAVAYSGAVILLGGEATTQTINFPVTGTFQYHCDRHFEDGFMIGTLKVT